MKPVTLYSVGITDYDSHHDLADFATLREARAFRVAIRAALKRNVKVDAEGRTHRECWIKTRHGWETYSDNGARPSFRLSHLVIHRHAVEAMPRVRSTEPPSERRERAEYRRKRLAAMTLEEREELAQMLKDRAKRRRRERYARRKEAARKP